MIKQGKIHIFIFNVLALFAYFLISVTAVKPITPELDQLKERLQKLGQSLEKLRTSLQTLLTQLTQQPKSPSSKKINQLDNSLNAQTIIQNIIALPEKSTQFIEQLLETKDTKNLLELLSTPYTKVIETQSQLPAPIVNTTTQLTQSKKTCQEPFIFFLLDQKNYALITSTIKFFSEQNIDQLLVLENAEKITFFKVLLEKYDFYYNDFDFNNRRLLKELLIALIAKISAKEIIKLDKETDKNLLSTCRFEMRQYFVNRISSILRNSVSALSEAFLDKIFLYKSLDRFIIIEIRQDLITYFLKNIAIFRQKINNSTEILLNEAASKLGQENDINSLTIAFANLLTELFTIESMHKFLETIVDTVKSNNALLYAVSTKLEKQKKLPPPFALDILAPNNLSGQKTKLITELRTALHSNSYSASDEIVTFLLELFVDESRETLFGPAEELSKYALLLAAKKRPIALSYFLKNYLFFSADQDSSFFSHNKKELLNALDNHDYTQAIKNLERYKDKEFLLHQEEDFTLSSLSAALHNIFSLQDQTLDNNKKLEISKLKKIFSELLSGGIEKNNLLIGNIFLGTLGISRQIFKKYSAEVLSPYSPTITQCLLKLISQKNKKIDELLYISRYETFNQLPYHQETLKSFKSIPEYSYIYENKNFLHMIILLPLLCGSDSIQCIDTYAPTYTEAVDQEIIFETLSLINERYTQNIHDCSTIDHTGRSILNCALVANIGEGALKELCHIIQKNIRPPTTQLHPILLPSDWRTPFLYEKTNSISGAEPYNSIELGGQFYQEVEGYRYEQSKPIKGYYRYYGCEKPNLAYKQVLKKFILEEIDRMGWKSDHKKLNIIQKQVQKTVDFHNMNPQKSNALAKEFDKKFLEELQKLQN